MDVCAWLVALVVRKTPGEAALIFNHSSSSTCRMALVSHRSGGHPINGKRGYPCLAAKFCIHKNVIGYTAPAFFFLCENWNVRPRASLSF